GAGVRPSLVAPWTPKRAETDKGDSHGTCESQQGHDGQRHRGTDRVGGDRRRRGADGRCRADDGPHARRNAARRRGDRQRAGIRGGSRGPRLDQGRGRHRERPRHRRQGRLARRRAADATGGNRHHSPDVRAPDLRGIGQSSIPADGYTKAVMAQDIHALVHSLGSPRIRLVGHDIGLMVAYAYAAQYPSEVDRIVLMDAFLPGVGNWRDVWLLRDLWHFHFYGETPLALVTGRERIYFEHFWNDFAADRTRSVPEGDRRIYTDAYARPGGMRAGFEIFRAFERDAQDFARFARTPLPMPMLVLTGQKASGDFLIEQ